MTPSRVSNTRCRVRKKRENEVKKEGRLENSPPPPPTILTRQARRPRRRRRTRSPPQPRHQPRRTLVAARVGRAAPPTFSPPLQQRTQPARRLCDTRPVRACVRNDCVC